ncbi:hypothetical protein B0H13DRAFT_1888934 [Mycena leptocephala]|nr:hypothetical protein B0H13DRAFT_1888934 [Mycena leptocephala]
MPPGRKPLDPAVKAERCRASLRRYAEKNAESLREAARVRMQRLRAAAAESPPVVQAAIRCKALNAAAKYRDRKQATIHAADGLRRAKKYIEQSGLEAFDEKNSRQYMAKTQRRHEGFPPPRPRVTPRPTERERSSRSPEPAARLHGRRSPHPQGRTLFLAPSRQRRSSSPEDQPVAPPPRPLSLKRRRPSSPDSIPSRRPRYAASPETPSPPQRTRCSPLASKSNLDEESADDSDASHRPTVVPPRKLPSLQATPKWYPLGVYMPTGINTLKGSQDVGFWGPGWAGPPIGAALAPRSGRKIAYFVAIRCVFVASTAPQ